MSPRRPNPKPEKRVHRDGAVTWFVRYRLDGVHTSDVFNTYAEARDFAADIRDLGTRAAVARLADRVAGVRTGPTVADVWAEFIEWKRPRVRSSRTIESYEASWRSIEPTFGAMPVDRVTEADVQRWVDGMLAGRVAPKAVGVGDGRRLVPVSAKTIVGRHGLLHSVFKFAAGPARGYVTANPCTGTELPRLRKGPPKGLRPGEWDALHAALIQVDQDAADLALALYATGARLGEVTALATFDVVDDGRTVTLTIGHVLRREAGSVFRRVEDTKSEAGFRRVTVDPDASGMFRRRLAAASPGGLLFTNRHGRPWLPSTFYLSWYAAVRVANLSRRPTPHWLRHTHVAEMLAVGVDLPKLQRRIGHEHISTTLDVYGGMEREVGDDVLERFASRRRRPVDPGGPVIRGEIL